MKIIQKGKRLLAAVTSICLAWTLAVFWCGNAMYVHADTVQNVMSDGVLSYRQSESMSTLIVTGAEREITGSLVIPSEYSGMKIVEIEEGAFSGQTGITEAVIPDTVQKIGAEAFSGCSSLSNVSLENTLQSAGADAFAGTAWKEAHAEDELMILDEVLLVAAADTVTEITLPDTVRVIADQACMGKPDLASVTLSGYTGYIGKKSFYGCSSLTNVILPSGVKDIGDYAFGESALSKAVVPATVLAIGKGAFIRCSQLQSVTLWEGLVRIGGSAFASCTSLKDITIPNSVTEIGASAFSRCTGMQKAVLGSSLTALSDNLFQDCTSMSSVTFGNNIISIGSGVFNKCTALQSAVLPETVKYIGSEAFQSCMSLTSVNIPESVVDVGVNAFFDTAFYNSLRAANTDSSFVIYDERVLLGYYGEDQYLQIPDGVQVIGGAAFAANETIEVIFLPDTVTSISSYAFDNLWTLKSITNTSNLRYIGAYAFWDCTSLESVVFHNGITVVREGTMFGCENLRTAAFENTVETIEQDAFTGTGLTEVELPSSVSLVESYAFDDCKKLMKITVRNNVCTLEPDSIPAGVEIWGYMDSTAYEYAQKYGNPFVDIQNPPATTTSTTTTTAEATITGEDTYTTTTQGTTTTTFETTRKYTTTTIWASTTGSHDENTTTTMQDTTTIVTTVTTMQLGVLAAGTVEISLDDLQAADYKVSVPVSVSETGGWYTLGYGISYDPSQLTAYDVTVDPVLASKVAEAGGSLKNYPAINKEEGVIWDAALPGINRDVSCPDGVFVYVDFVVNQNAQPGDVYDVILLESNNGNYQEIEAAQGEGCCRRVNGAVLISGEATVGTDTSVTTTTATTTITTTTTTTTVTTMTTASTGRTTATTTTTTTETTTTATTASTTRTTATTATTTTASTASTIWTTITTTTTTTAMTTMYTTVTSGTAVSAEEGDVDFNGAVDLADAAAILSVYAKMAVNIAVPEEREAASDVNGDGRADLDDAVLLLTYYASVGAGLTDLSFADWRDAQ